MKISNELLSVILSKDIVSNKIVDDNILYFERNDECVKRKEVFFFFLDLGHWLIDQDNKFTINNTIGMDVVNGFYKGNHFFGESQADVYLEIAESEIKSRIVNSTFKNLKE